MLAQLAIQHRVDTCCLRAPWIMEKGDFRCSLSLGYDGFGGPVWNTFVAPEVAKRCQAAGTVPLLRDALGHPLKRNIVHVEDLVAAILAALDNPAARNKLYNVCMDGPVDYGAAAAYLKEGGGYAATSGTVFPRLFPVSSAFCASAAWARGKVRATTGRTLPSSISRPISASSAALGFAM
jgi:nucleoside-diphosphate-sugar epimerase